MEGTFAVIIVFEITNVPKLYAIKVKISAIQKCTYPPLIKLKEL